MNPLLAASLFDSPWVILAIMAASAIANWLAKRRQQQQEQQERQEELENSSAAPEPELSHDLDRRLRELLGQETSPLPPPIIREVQTEDWARPAGGEIPTARQHSAVPIRLPPPLNAGEVEKPVAAETRRPSRLTTEAAPPVAVDLQPRWQARRRKVGAVDWRNPRSARQAFVASLVFGPPKGLES